VKLFSKNSNLGLYDHDASTDGQTDLQTDGHLALAIPRSVRLRTIKKNADTIRYRTDNIEIADMSIIDIYR